MARLSLAPDLPLILCFRLIAAGDSPPVFRPVPPLDFTFGGRATDRRSSPPLPPPLPSPLVEWQVAQAPRCAQFARSLVRN